MRAHKRRARRDGPQVQANAANAQVVQHVADGGGGQAFKRGDELRVGGGTLPLMNGHVLSPKWLVCVECNLL